MTWLAIIFLIIVCFNFIHEAGLFGIVVVALFVILIVVVGSAQSAASEEEAKKKAEKKNKMRNDIMSGEYPGFKPTKELASTFCSITVFVDEYNRKVMFVNYDNDKILTYRFNEIIECTILEDGATIQSGGVGRAVVGGIVAGGVGAVVGANTRTSKAVTLSLSVRIITSNIQSPLYEIPIIQSQMKRNSDDYKLCMQFAQKVYATMVSITNSVNNTAYPRGTRRF